MIRKLLTLTFIIALILVIIYMLFSSNNPYAKYCLDQGYRVQSINIEGAIVNPQEFCIFPDGQKCELDHFYKGYCMWNPTTSPICNITGNC